MRLVLPQQVHGYRVVRRCYLADGPADGLWDYGSTARLGIRTADCIPVLLATSTGYVAAIHAGWRGVVACIVERFLQRQLRFGREPKQWTVALGPAAGGCCYQVGPEVCEALGLIAEERYLDLRLLLAERLQQLGVGIIDFVGPCTICSKDGWASYRREGKQAGRNLAWIGVP
ncbi:purine nucleoside phosphorylase DR_1966-like [Ylistrum balloti]|uniref:purine nucleoside phosphorylase DR_1966-like n=1 Tax=Ylistrum balloti TaxID=509963 RepID=UPI002905AE39|nr:purine nucleoside phosphorylase DR_1966-like [Ylistrum balloti]